MEQKFIIAWSQVREQAANIGIKMRPIADGDALKAAHRILQGHRESDGFFELADKKRLDLSLEALAIDKRFTALFSDEEANTALDRLLFSGYYR